MDFQKFVSDAGSALNRAVQFTQESIGTAEKTEYDSRFQNLLTQADQAQVWTEKLLKAVEEFVQPNPALRVKEAVSAPFERNKPVPERITPSQELGKVMQDAADALDMGAANNTKYTAALGSIGKAEQTLAQTEKIFIEHVRLSLLDPLRNFIDNELKTIQKERKTLESKRLDLDVAKTKLKRSKNDSNKMAVESEMKFAQAAFDSQQETTRLLLEGVVTWQNNQIKSLTEFIDSQMNYHIQCHQTLQDVKRHLSS